MFSEHFWVIFAIKNKRVTERRTDGRTDGPTNPFIYRCEDASKNLLPFVQIIATCMKLFLLYTLTAVIALMHLHQTFPT